MLFKVKHPTSAEWVHLNGHRQSRVTSGSLGDVTCPNSQVELSEEERRQYNAAHKAASRSDTFARLIKEEQDKLASST